MWSPVCKMFNLHYTKEEIEQAKKAIKKSKQENRAVNLLEFIAISNGKEE